MTSLLKTLLFLGAVAELPKATIYLIMSVFPSKYLSISVSIFIEQFRSHWTDFDEMLYLSFSRKSVEKIQVLLKIL